MKKVCHFMSLKSQIALQIALHVLLEIQNNKLIKIMYNK